eukprot:TRINITY_DN7645_c0_g1_i1.p2 TRINITY_DN7645_c0_g1~~TRINITY_DN7645_c0_g1_i1.p2  ORF type:complete len:142 (-),score=39.49 TRINITY_DN7645_c0_g1_i1:105-530(-)
MANDVMYFMCFSIKLNRTDEPLEQWIATNDGKLALRLKRVKYENEGACCGQTRCFACVVGGLTATWHRTETLPYADYLKNKKLWDMLVCDNEMVDLDDLVEALGGDAGEQEEEAEETDDSDECQVIDDGCPPSSKKRKRIS